MAINVGTADLTQLQIPELRHLALDRERKPAEFWTLYGMILQQLLKEGRLELAARLWNVADLQLARTLVRALPTMNALP